MYKYILLSFALLSILSGCRDDPEPGPGFTESFYVEFDLENEHVKLESDNPELQYALQPGSGNNFTNIFRTNGHYDVEMTVHMTFDPTRNDIQNLANENLPITNDEGVPWIRFYLINNHQPGIDYSTNVDPLDYGISSVVVDEIIKGPSVDYFEPQGGKKRKGTSYILRGTFDFQISRNFWSQGEPVELFDMRNGKFSIRVFTP